MWSLRYLVECYHVIVYLLQAVTIFACVAVARAGAPVAYQIGNPSIGIGGANTVRGFAGLSSVTHQAKVHIIFSSNSSSSSWYVIIFTPFLFLNSQAVDSPFSTVRKTDTRVTNDAVAVSFYKALNNFITAYT